MSAKNAEDSQEKRRTQRRGMRNAKEGKHSRSQTSPSLCPHDHLYASASTITPGLPFARLPAANYDACHAGAALTRRRPFRYEAR